MKNLIISGKLPCTIDDCTTLAALQFRIYELETLFTTGLQTSTTVPTSLLFNIELNDQQQQQQQQQQQKLNNNSSNSCSTCFSNFSFINICICLSNGGSKKLLTKKQLVSPDYLKTKGIMKLIRVS
jgi:hypothetical protein